MARAADRRDRRGGAGARRRRHRRLHEQGRAYPQAEQNERAATPHPSPPLKGGGGDAEPRPDLLPLKGLLLYPLPLEGEGQGEARLRKGLCHGFQLRHRRSAQCRQIDALQRADRDAGGRGGELSVLHHRAQCRARRGAGRAARRLRRVSPNRRRSCRRSWNSSTSPGWCAAPPKAKASATSSSAISARSTRSRMCCAASRTATSPMSKARSIRSAMPRRWRPS